MRGRRRSARLRDIAAVAGRTGTLRTRMRGTAAAGRCQAKTGTLTGVSALAGYCHDAPTAHTLAFAILMNDGDAGAAHSSRTA